MSFRDLQTIANNTLLADVAFGELITYTPQGVGSQPVEVYAAAAEQEFFVTGGDIPISTTRTVLRLRSADIVGGVQVRAGVLWRDASYRIERVDGPDDSGIVTCSLNRLTTP